MHLLCIFDLQVMYRNDQSQCKREGPPEEGSLKESKQVPTHMSKSRDPRACLDSVSTRVSESSPIWACLDSVVDHLSNCTCKCVQVCASMCKCVYYCCDGSSLCTQGFYLLRQELHITSHGLNIFAETRMLHLCFCLHWLVLPSIHVPVVHTNGVVHRVCV